MSSKISGLTKDKLKKMEDEMNRFEAEISDVMSPQSRIIPPVAITSQHPLGLPPPPLPQQQQLIAPNAGLFMPHQLKYRPLSMPPLPPPPHAPRGIVNYPPPPPPQQVIGLKTVYTAAPQINDSSKLTQAVDPDSNNYSNSKAENCLPHSQTNPQTINIATLTGVISGVDTSKGFDNQLLPAFTIVEPPVPMSARDINSSVAAAALVMGTNAGPVPGASQLQQPQQSARRHNKSAGKASAKNKKESKKFLRSAGGIVWEDKSLDEWDPSDFRMFCGDLGNEVSDEVLTRVFNRYPSFKKAKVIRSKRTQKSKGYGFVSFSDPADFSRAIKEMNGKYVGNRPIKLKRSEWANRQYDVVKKREKDRRKFLLKF